MLYKIKYGFLSSPFWETAWKTTGPTNWFLSTTTLMEVPIAEGNITMWLLTLEPSMEKDPEMHHTEKILFSGRWVFLLDAGRCCESLAFSKYSKFSWKKLGTEMPDRVELC